MEGPITLVGAVVSLEERRAEAYRHLGAEIGDLYLAATAADAPHSVVFRMVPERSRTTDYAKQFG